jgi:hypothetical protein
MQGVVILHAAWKRDAQLLGCFAHHHHTIRSFIAQAPRLDGAIGKQLPYGADLLLHCRIIGIMDLLWIKLVLAPRGHIPGRPMKVVQIYIFCLKPPARRSSCSKDLVLSEL